MKTLERVDADVAEVAREMARLAEEEGLRELTVEVGKRSLRVRRTATGWGMPVSTELPPAEEPSDEEVALAAGVPMTSEVVGIWRNATREGARVKKGQVLGSIESVSIKHELRSTEECVVAELLVADGEPVQYGQVVLVVQADV